MTEGDYQNSNHTPQLTPSIKSNWWRLIVYLVFFLISTGIFTLPIFLFFPEVFGNYDLIENNAAYLLSSQAATFAGVIATTYMISKEIEYKSRVSYRLSLNLRSLGAGFLLGVLIMAIIGIAFYVFGLVHFSYNGFSSTIIVSFLSYLLVALIEETIFRGYVLTNMQEKNTEFWAATLSSVLFGLFHFGNDHFTWIGCATIAISGYLMAIMALKSGSISSAVGFHWSWNFVQGPILGFAVSGHAEKGVFQVNSTVTDVLTGGKFGAEGSILVALFTLTLAVYFSSKTIFADQKKTSGTLHR